MLASKPHSAQKKHHPARSIRGNQKLLLNEPETVWLIKTGTVAVFAIETVAGQPKGRRHHLFDVEADQLLLGASTPAQAHHQWVAVAIGEATVQPIPVAQLEHLFTEHPSRVQAWLQQWLDHVASTVADPVPSNQPYVTLPPASPEALQEYQLSAAQWLQPEELVQIRLTAGTADLMGTVPLAADTAPLDWILLSPKMNLHGQQAILQYRFAQSLEISDWLSSLTVLRERVTAHLTQRYTQALQHNAEQLQQRQAQDHEQMDSAISSLATVLNPQAELTVDNPADSSLMATMRVIGEALGVPISSPSIAVDISLDNIARASNLRTRRVLLSDQWWRKEHGPLLASYDGMPVALLPHKRGCRLWRPDTQQSVRVNAQLADQLDPDAYTFYLPFADQELTWKEIVGLVMRGRSRDLGLVFLVAFSVSLLNLLVPILTGRFVNEVIPDDEINLLWQMGGLLLASTLSITLLKLTQAFTLLRFESAADATIQAAMWDRVLKLKPSVLRKYSTGDLRLRIDGITKIQKILNGSTVNSILTGMFAFTNLGLMFFYSPKLTWVACGIAVLCAGVTILVGYRSLSSTGKLQKQAGTVSSVIIQLVNGISKLRVSGAEERAFAHWGRLYQRRVFYQSRLTKASNIMNLFNQGVSPLSLILLFWMAVVSIETASGSGGLTVGGFVAFYSAYNTFLSSITQLSGTVVSSLSIVTLWRRAQPILKAKPEHDLAKLDPGILSGRVAVEHVTFRYDKNSPYVLHDVSLKAKSGEFIAIVGESGSGKSTLMRLLLGFEMPNAGEVFYDRQALSKLNLQEVRRQFGVVLQNIALSSGSIFDIVASGGIITQQEAWQALQMAGLAEEVKAMPMQLHTVVSEGGSNLSGGQQQRLLIAQALARQPKFILFDEATSALDNETQAIVSESLEKLNVTRIVIAHRLSTIRYADRIYVLSKGRICQKGTFAQLMKEEGLFADLMHRQLAD